jgi:TonB-linked SusC/RagA family outer membrane protein
MTAIMTAVIKALETTEAHMRVVPSLICVLVLLGAASSAWSQDPVTEVAMARGPRFLYAPTSKETLVRVDVKRTPVLSRRITLDLHDVTLEEALESITQQAGLRLTYSKALVPLDKKVRIKAEDITVAAAITEVLIDVDVDVVFTRSGQAVLMSRSATGAAIEAVGMITGVVTDASDGRPIPSVQIAVEGTRLGALTDDRGAYTIRDVGAGARRITARRVGYSPKTRDVTVVDNAAATVDFALTRVATRLDEVVTTVTGGQRRVELGHTVAQISADSLVREAPVMSLSDVLTARVAGVQIVTANGATGMSPRIRIRGLNSATVTNDPLIVVDGTRIENSPGTGQELCCVAYGFRGGRLNDLNPEEIESIAIVKGPSAATLYGTDAANGVILITTKRGQAGRAQWTWYGEEGLVTQPTHFLDNYYAWGHSLTTGAIQQCTLSSAVAGTCAIDSVTTYNPLNDRAVSMIGTGHRHQTGVQVRGGASRFGYFVSGEREAETGFLRMPAPEVLRIETERGVSALPEEQIHPNALEKNSLRGNFTTSFTENADAAISTGVIQNYVRNPGFFPYFAAYFGPGARNINGGYNPSSGAKPGEQFAVRAAEHTTHFVTSTIANYRPLTWLTARVTGGMDFSSAMYEGLQRWGEGPIGSGRNGRRLNIQSDVSLYTADLGASAQYRQGSRMSWRTSAGMQYNRREERTTQATATGLSPGSQTTNGGSVLSGGETNVNRVVAGAYLEQMAALDERLFLSAALRMDGGSAFGRNFQTAAYPKLSASWLVRSQTSGAQYVLTSLRARVAYGASGVQPSPTAALPLLATSPVIVDGAAATGATLSAIGNADLKPERQRELEAGLDADLLGNRVHVEATHYRRRSTDALFNIALPPSIGVASQQKNIGSVSNRGIEAIISAHALETRTVTWDVTLNGSYNTNRIEELYAGLASTPANPFAGLRVGYPIQALFSRPYTYADANGNGIIEATELTLLDSLKYHGSPLPRQQVSVATTVGLLSGRLRVSTLVDYRGDFAISNLNEVNRCFFNFSRSTNDPRAPLDQQAACVARKSKGAAASGGFYSRGDFVSWRELSASYDLPSVVTRQVRANRATLTLTGRNLGIRTNYQGLSPEVTLNPNFAEGNNDNEVPPPSRYWLMRLNVAF